MPSHYEALQEELKSLPAHDAKERRNLEERIEAVRTATVDGVHYETPLDVQRARLKESGRVHSEKFIQLTDLARQYDPHGAALGTLVDEVQKSALGAGVPTLGKVPVGRMIEDSALLIMEQEEMKDLRKQHPDKTTEELREKANMYASMKLDSPRLDSVEYKEYDYTLQKMQHEYRAIVEAETTQGNLKITMVDATKEGERYYPIYEIAGKAADGINTVDPVSKLKDLQKQMEDLPKPSYIDKDAMNNNIEREIQHIYKDANGDKIDNNPALSEGDKRTYHLGVEERAKQLYEERHQQGKETSMTPLSQDDKLRALAEAFKNEPAAPGTSIPRKGKDDTIALSV